jgi:hypothetical protein
MSRSPRVEIASAAALASLSISAATVWAAVRAKALLEKWLREVQAIHARSGRSILPRHPKPSADEM